jgi:hypothetical protein
MAPVGAPAEPDAVMLVALIQEEGGMKPEESISETPSYPWSR